MKLFSWVISVSLMVIFTLTTFAQEVIESFPIPEGDISALILKLATDYKTLGAMGIIVLAVLLSVQLIKKFVNDGWKYKRLLVLGVSIVYSILSGVVLPGSNIITVIVTVFITSGGAIALFEVLKGSGIIKSKK